MPVRKAHPVECPVCEFALRGTPTEGYRCVRCHARYSTKFVRALHRQAMRAFIEAHFSPAHAPTPTAKAASPVLQAETVREHFVVAMPEDSASSLPPVTQAPAPPMSVAPLAASREEEGEETRASRPESIDDFIDLEQAFRSRVHARTPPQPASHRLREELSRIPLYVPKAAAAPAKARVAQPALSSSKAKTGKKAVKSSKDTARKKATPATRRRR